MKISVIVPVFEDWKRLTNCLDALEDQNLDSTKFEVIVVDNAVSPVDYNHLEIASNTFIIHEPLPGSYAARNKGAEHASGEFLAFTDSDCMPHEDWLANAIKRFEADDCDLIGGEIDIFRPSSGSNHMYIYDKFTAFHQDKNIAEGKCVTANLIVKRSVFEELGGFDSSLKSGGDWEFSKRFMENHYSMVFDDTVTVSHPAKRDLRELLRKQYRFVSWGGIMAKKTYGYTDFRITLSEVYNSLKTGWRVKQKDASLKERWILFYVKVIKKIFRILVRIAITLKIIDPKSVRK